MVMGSPLGKRLQRLCSDIWWLVLLRGIAVAILGVLLVSRPLENSPGMLAVFWHWFRHQAMAIVMPDW